jgi:hypothetical protein
MHVGSSQLVFAYADSEEIGATMAIRLALSDRTSVEEAVYKIAWLRAYGLDSGMLEGLGRASTFSYVWSHVFVRHRHHHGCGVGVSVSGVST